MDGKQFHEKRISQSGLHELDVAFSREQLALIEYRLEHNIPPENGTMWDGIDTCAELVMLITLFTVIIAGDSLASEFSTGTIKLLLIRPASRLKILISKYVSMLMFGFLLLVTLFVVSVLVNGALFSFEHMDLPFLYVNSEGQIIEGNMVANLWKLYLLNGVSTIMFVTMAFMISTAFRSSALAIGFSIFTLFAGMVFSDMVRAYAWGKYVLFSNINLWQHLIDKPYQEGMTMTFSITVLVVYFIIFNLVAYVVFTRRDVAA